MKAPHFFDVVRRGAAAESTNAYFASEGKKIRYLQTAKFQKGKDEYRPVPLNQLNYSRGMYVQNVGW